VHRFRGAVAVAANREAVKYQHGVHALACVPTQWRCQAVCLGSTVRRRRIAR
jgi:hypothetical protein